MSKIPKLPPYIQEIKKMIAKHISQTFPGIQVSSDEIRLEKPPNIQLGEFALACFPFAKAVKKSPVDVASALASGFTSHKYVEKLEAMGPYLNLHLKMDVFHQTICHAILSGGDEFGKSDLGKGKKVMVEYSSPNTNKPLHIGHVRNNLIGMALANILEFVGFSVIKANLINDRGIHICKTMLAYQKHGKGETPDSTHIKGDHFVGNFYVKFDSLLKEERIQYAKEKNIALDEFSKEKIQELKDKIKACTDKAEQKKYRESLKNLENKAEEFEEQFLKHSKLYQEAEEMLVAWERGDPEVRKLWKEMRDWVLKGFETTYKTLGCSFDKIYFESDTYTLGRQYVEQGLASGVFYQKEDKSIWVSAEKLKEIAVESFQGIPIKDKLLLRGDGTSVYITQDIGTAILKYKDYDLAHSLYVVADEQNLHFKILFAILSLLGFSWAKNCHHLAYGMVTLPRGMGKIKSREGTAVDADDLISEMVDRARQEIQTGKVHVLPEKIEETALDIALAALKVFILQVSMEKNIQFDPEKTIEFTGDTGPAIQYSHARICSMIRKAEEEHGVKMEGLESKVDYSLLNTTEEKDILRHLCDFPQVVCDCAQTYSIHLLTNYLLSLTKSYARLYDMHPVLRAETQELRNARLVLAKCIAQVIKNGMRLLGANVPQSM